MNPINTAPFTEYVAVKEKQSTNNKLDIIINAPISLDNYCQALLEKILTLTYSDYIHFLKHQTAQVQSPIIWLDELEQFLCWNEELFIEKRMLHRYDKIHHCIEIKREVIKNRQSKIVKVSPAKRYINAESEERYFSFYEIKKELDLLQDDNQKILFLTKEKHEYRQANIEFINQKLPQFDKQCSKEIEQIYEMQTIKSTINKLSPTTMATTESFTKLKFNCNVNQFVDIFYQFTREMLVDGKPFIEGNINDVITMIVNSYVDKEGKEISALSVKTILKPSREDKRPNTHKRIDISKLL